MGVNQSAGHHADAWESRQAPLRHLRLGYDYHRVLVNKVLPESPEPANSSLEPDAQSLAGPTERRGGARNCDEHERSSELAVLHLPLHPNAQEPQTLLDPNRGAGIGRVVAEATCEPDPHGCVDPIEQRTDTLRQEERYVEFNLPGQNRLPLLHQTLLNDNLQL